MRRVKLEPIVQRILDTSEDEITCSECFDAISPYVELEMQGTKVSDEMARVRHHLGQCRVCREEYETLRDLVRSERETKTKAVNRANRRH